MTLSPLQFLTFACIAGLLIFLTLTWLAPAPHTPPPTLDSNVAEWFAINATHITIEENGTPKHHLHAERLTHYDQLKQTSIIQPRATVFRNPGEPWQLRADSGLAYHESAEEMEEIDLSGQVLIWQEASKQDPYNQITTDFIKFSTKTNIVTTDQLVTFNHGKHRLSGVGLWADLNTEEIQLHDQVQGKFVND